MQKFISKEQECEELKKEAVNLKLNLKKVINLSQKKNRQCYQFLADIKQLKAENKHLNDLLNQALKELEELQEGLANGQETSYIHNRTSGLIQSNI